jgi:hypothetical protein
MAVPEMRVKRTRVPAARRMHDIPGKVDVGGGRTRRDFLSELYYIDSYYFCFLKKY